MLVLVALLACGGAPGPCHDAACREEAIRAVFAQDPCEAEPLVASIEDPVERLVVVRALMEQNPGQAEPLCRYLEDEESRKWCLSVNKRPHLWAERPRQRAEAPTADLGPRSATLSMDPSWRPELALVPAALDHGCA